MQKIIYFICYFIKLHLDYFSHYHQLSMNNEFQLKILAISILDILQYYYHYFNQYIEIIHQSIIMIIYLII